MPKNVREGGGSALRLARHAGDAGHCQLRQQLHLARSSAQCHGPCCPPCSMRLCHCNRCTWQEDQNSTLLLPTVVLSLVGTFPGHILQQGGQEVEVDLISVSVGLHAGHMLLQ